MSAYSDASLKQLDESIRETPERSEAAVNELLSRIEGSARTSRTAAMTLRDLAADHPESLADHVDIISSKLYHATEQNVRKWLTATLVELVEELPQVGDEASRGLSEATRVRLEKIEGRDGDREVRVVGRALDGWIVLARNGHTVPPEVVENARKILEVADTGTLASAIKVFGMAIVTESPRADLALDVLAELGDVDDEFTRRHATEALARAVVAGSGMATSEEVYQVLVQNRELANAEAVPEAISLLEQ